MALKSSPLWSRQMVTLLKKIFNWKTEPGICRCVCVSVGVGVCTEPAHTHFSACLVTGDLQCSKTPFFIDSLCASHHGWVFQGNILSWWQNFMQYNLRFHLFMNNLNVEMLGLKTFISQFWPHFQINPLLGRNIWQKIRKEMLYQLLLLFYYH